MDSANRHFGGHIPFKPDDTENKIKFTPTIMISPLSRPVKTRVEYQRYHSTDDSDVMVGIARARLGLC